MMQCFWIVDSLEGQEGSDTFYWSELACALAESQGEWFQLSGDLGLLPAAGLGELCEKPTKASKSGAQWEERVLADLLKETKAWDKLIFFSQRRYTGLWEALVTSGRRVEAPLGELSVPDQILWLKSQLDERIMSRQLLEAPDGFTAQGSASTGDPVCDSPLEEDASDQATLLGVILEQMAEGVIVANREGRFQFFNPQAEALLGPKPELSPHQWSEYFLTQQMDETGTLRPVLPDRVPLIRALSGEQIDNEEYFLGRGRNRQGVWISVNSRMLRNAAGEPIGAVSVCRDVTALKAAEQEARRANRDFHQVIETSRDGVGIHREGRWVYVNPALLVALGYQDLSELCSIPLWDLLPRESRAEARNWLWAPVEGKLPPVATFEFLRRDGTRVSMEVCPALLTEFEGDEAVLVVFRDITERKKLESQLMIADRMASLGTVASGVGHEINNPLSIVMMNLELALQELQSGSTGAAGNQSTSGILTDALVAAQRVRRIVSHLQIFSSSSESRSAEVELQAVLESTAGVLNNEIRFRAVLIKNYAQELPNVVAIESKLAQVALNLLLNALQSIPEGDPESNRIVLSTEQAGDFVRFSVSDTGTGISPEVGRQMFTPFFSTKAVGAGTGLGLAICYQLVTSMGGSIRYESTPGEGSTFFVSLPAVAAHQAPTKVPVVAEETHRFGRVLVVDDEPAVCRMLKRALSSEHSVDVCEDGGSALCTIQSGSRYDVILCDVMMPLMNGLQLYDALTAEAPDQAARMIFLTGGVFTDSARSLLAQTARPVLHKPCGTEELRAMVRLSVAGLPNQ